MLSLCSLLWNLSAVSEPCMPLMVLLQLSLLTFYFVRQVPATDLCQLLEICPCVSWETVMSVKIKWVEPVAQQLDVILDLSDIVWCVCLALRAGISMRQWTCWSSGSVMHVTQCGSWLADFKATLEQETNSLFIGLECCMGLHKSFPCAPHHQV